MESKSSSSPRAWARLVRRRAVFVLPYRLRLVRKNPEAQTSHLDVSLGYFRIGLKGVEHGFDVATNM